MQYSDILGLTSQQILFELVRRNSNFDQKDITLDKLTIGPANITNAHERDSMVIVSPAPGTGLINPVTVYYNRIVINELSLYQDSPQRWLLHIGEGSPPEHASDLLELIATTYGIMLTKQDIIDSRLDSTYPLEVDIPIRDDNQVWIGFLPVVVYKGIYDLKKVITQQRLPGLVYPSSTLTKVQGPVVSYGWWVGKDELLDGTDLPSDGKVLSETDNYSKKLVALLNSRSIGLRYEMDGVTGNDSWSLSSVAGKLNLNGAVVVRDPVKIAALPFTIRKDSDRCLILKLSDKATAIGGHITLYESSTITTPLNGITTENGIFLLTEDGAFILSE